MLIQENARYRSKTRFLTAIALSAFVSATNAAITYNFNAGNSGFTATTDANFAGPWLYASTGGVGDTGAWTTIGQDPENSQNLLNTARLTTPAMIAQGGPVMVSFEHMFSFESDGGNWDGGAVFVSVNGSAVTQLAGSDFSSNGYNGTVVAGNSFLTTKEAFVANSDGRDTNIFNTSVANLGSFVAGDQIQVQWVAAFDTNTKGPFLPAWAIDNVTVNGVVPEPTITLSLLTAGAFLAVRRRRAY